jgi:hypothetical protein
MFSHKEILINPKGYGVVHYVSVKKMYNFLPLYQLFFPK